jgi:hypothetical protein
MESQELISIVNKFNHCINNQDLEGLSDLMSEDHLFIDRDGKSHGPKSFMVDGWKRFFKMFPEYKNTFEKFNTIEDRVYVLGFAYWTKDEPYDPVIWMAKIEQHLIKEWQIYVDTPENREKFRL